MVVSLEALTVLAIQELLVFFITSEVLPAIGALWLSTLGRLVSLVGSASVVGAVVVKTSTSASAGSPPSGVVGASRVTVGL